MSDPMLDRLFDSTFRSRRIRKAKRQLRFQGFAVGTFVSGVLIALREYFI